MLWFREPLFFFSKVLKVTTVPSGTVATIAKYIYIYILNIYVSWYIYCFTDTTNFTIFSKLLTCANALKHCSYSTLISQTIFFPNFWTVSGNIATIAIIFFFFFFIVIGLCFFFFFFLLNIYVSWYILLYWHKKFHNIFTIIDVSISYKPK